MDIFLQQVINGLTLGSIYAVVALGYTMVYGIIQLINFAHGEVVMVGAMVALSVIAGLAGTGLSPIVIVLAGVACAVPACMALGFLMERVAYRPLRGAPRLAPLITAIGLSIILQHLALLIWSRNPLSFPQIMANPVFEIAGANVSAVQIGIMLGSLLMMAGLTLLVYRTRLGVAMRATSENPQVAGLMGVNINQVISLTFIIGAGLAGAGVAERLVERILSHRVFSDPGGQMNLSLRDVGGALLLVPQFTLAADTRKGTRPSFTAAAPPEEGKRLFEHLLACARASHSRSPVERISSIG